MQTKFEYSAEGTKITWKYPTRCLYSTNTKNKYIYKNE